MAFLGMLAGLLPCSYPALADFELPLLSTDSEKLLGPGDPDSARMRVLVSPDDPVYGPLDAAVTIVEFGDFECPFTSRAAVTMRQLLMSYPGQIRLVFKHTPLPGHPHAFAAAEAAMAAHEQGRFWAFHDLLVTNRDKLDRTSLDDYARQIGLDMDRYAADLDSHKHAARIETTQSYARARGISATPMFLVNGMVIAGAGSVAKFKAIIEQEIEYAEEWTARNRIIPSDLYFAIMRHANPGPMRKGRSLPIRAIDPSKTYRVPVGDSPAKGEPTAPLTTVIFCDFECRLCAAIQPRLQELAKRYGKDIRFVWKNLPLGWHIFAPLAAKAALAAHEQGKFWTMHDRLYAGQPSLTPAALGRLAGEIGLDRGQFEAALDSARLRSSVRGDSLLAEQLGLVNTPAVFVNGRPLAGAKSAKELGALCDQELARARRMLASGTNPNKLYEDIIEQASPGTAESRPGGRPVDQLAQGNSPSLGSPSAPVTVIEFADFQCPYCSRAAKTARELLEQYPGKVRVVFKNLALPFHEEAVLAAEAALAAHEQGKFWEMHDLLFSNPRYLSRRQIERYASSIGLDMSRFKDALDSGRFKVQVTADGDEALSAGITGVPTFLVNGRVLVGAQPIEAFKAIIDEELGVAAPGP
ncbi:MAG: thioredoxin domain-containing protein [Pseudomonadota bacterium]